VNNKNIIHSTQTYAANQFANSVQTEIRSDNSRKFAVVVWVTKCCEKSSSSKISRTYLQENSDASDEFVQTAMLDFKFDATGG